MKPRPMVVNGWHLYTHPAFKEYVRKLALAVGKIKARIPDSWKGSNIVSLYKAIARTCLIEVPNDPSNSRYRQGNTLGKTYRHWLRAKPANRHRLFFRYDRERKVIAYVWISGPKQLRSAGSKRDPYAVFAKLLTKGDIPDNWSALIERCELIDESDADWQQI